ncbi:MAG: OprD family outer membrane porin [Gammaproteobacteria bacterium]|nr:OprD family outer membrane porin [Gammaproteobacteria bacterium]
MFFSISNITFAFESIKQRHEKNSISKEVKTIELTSDEEQDSRIEHGFLADAKILLHSRTYLFDHDRESDPSSGRINNDRYSVATGGWVNYQSGYYNDWLGIGLTQYGSYQLDGSKNEDGALLLRPDQESINVLGEAYIEVLHQFGNFKVYRQKITTPFMNSNDNRMLPQTFEAVKFSSSKGSKTDYIFAYADKMKTRNGQTFQDINKVVNNDEGVWVAGLRHRFMPLFRAGLISYHAKDYLDIHYAELDGTQAISEQSNLKYALQFIEQESTGQEQGGDIDSNAWGLRLTYALYQWQFFFNYTDVDNNHRILFPWSSYAGYNSVQVNDFNRAGEEAIGVGAGYNFSNLGFKGLTASVKYVDGDTPDNGKIASSDQTEINYDVQYVIQQGALEGISVRLRYADVDRQPYTSDTQARGSGFDVEQFRIIINYEVQF